MSYRTEIGRVRVCTVFLPTRGLQSLSAFGLAVKMAEDVGFAPNPLARAIPFRAGASTLVWFIFQKVEAVNRSIGLIVFPCSLLPAS